VTHLLQIALGPVQGFIATARRSRDLWFGSYILSELSKAAAAALARETALIFPAPQQPGDLEPGSPFLVANIVTAQADGADLARAQALLLQARAGVEARWRALCKEALDELEPDFRSRDRARRIDLIREEVWQAQIDDVVEFSCAAVPVAAGTTYQQANDRLRELMGQRKNTRWFAPYAEDFRLPKSSLDGARSTVLREFDGAAAPEARLARMRAGMEPAEQLDTAGTVKRVVGRARGFVPVARVAAQRWLERAESEHPALMQALAKSYDALRHEGLATELKGKYRSEPEYGWVARFPYDAQLLYPERVEAEVGKLQRALGLLRKGWAQDSLAVLVDQLRRDAQALQGKLGGPPQPYYGMLLADGDRMGELIDRATQSREGAATHRRVSQALSAFAQSVPKRMASAGGACIYSGGDDVFGLVPLHRALACADTLRQDFAQAMAGVAAELGLAEALRPTLSVGIAIVHMLEPLADARELARRAEALAKGKRLKATGADRDALALIAKPRSGSEYACRIRWRDQASLARLQAWALDLDQGRVPGGLPHELDAVWSECAQVFPADEPAHAEDLARLWKARVSTVLAKKRLDDGSALPAEATEALRAALCTDAAGSRAALDQLLLARWLGAHAQEVQ
jgi:CRISPR-associated protein Cmr2